MDSKIVLKCWLDDKLKAADIESRVPIHAVDDISRKYEFSFLSQSGRIALSYCYERANLSNEKLNILEGNSQSIHIIYIVNHINGSGNGQYPESLMKIQDRQGYCLFLIVDGIDYNKAKMEAVYYAQDIDGVWKEILFEKGLLKDFDIDKDGQILCEGVLLSNKLSKAKELFRADIERERSKRSEKQKRYVDELKRIYRREEDRREKCRKQQEEAERECKRQAEEKENAEKHLKKSKALKGNNRRQRSGGRFCERAGRYGKFVGCSNFPKCRYTCQI